MFGELPHGIAPASFIHKKILGVAAGFIPGGNTALDLAGDIFGGGGGTRTRKQERAQRRAAGDAARRAEGTVSVNVSGMNNTSLLQLVNNPLAAIGNKRAAAALLRRRGIDPNLGVQALASSGPCGNPPRPGCVPVDLPSTPTITTPAEGDFQAVQGAFGMPAIAPKSAMRQRFVCPPGMVLGDDNLCYPKAVLRRSSRFRKWRPGRKAVLTGGDLNKITAVKTIIGTARNAISGLGITVKKK